jgi:hypothetical protein
MLQKGTIDDNMFTQKNQPVHHTQLRKRRRLSEVAYPGYKRVRIVKKVTKRSPTEYFICFTTSLVMMAAILGAFYSILIFMYK